MILIYKLYDPQNYFVYTGSWIDAQLFHDLEGICEILKRSIYRVDLYALNPFEMSRSLKMDLRNACYYTRDQNIELKRAM